MTAFLQDFAAKRGLFCKTDSIGNVVIVREAMPGKEQVPTIVLQCHQDMVCEKNPGVEHDFSRDPISYVVEDGWMIAPDTTLGADDGIGIAAALAVLESDLPTGRLECVFTISEETGIGGLDTFGTFRYFREVRNAGWKGLKISVSNALGGHSGDDINKGRANAVQQLVRFLYGELPHGLQLILLHGGGKPNAIAREASSLILVPDAEATLARFEAFKTLARFEAFKADVKGEFSVADPNVVLQAEASPCNEKPIDSVVARRLIATLYGLPHGVLAMSPDIPGLVETSTNLAAVRMNERGVVKVITSQRSAVPSERRDAAARVEAVLKLGGAEVDHLLEYPGWKPNVHSPILEACVASYRKLFQTEPEVKAIHAGLECGLFGEKFGDLDMISFGPTLRGVHAPGERLELASLEKFAALLEDVLVNFNG